MLVQTLQGYKESMAEVTLPAPATPVVRMVIGLVLRRAGPVDQVLGDHATGILAAHELVQHITAHTGCLRTGATLYVVGEAGGCRIAALAEGTLNLLAAMGTRVEMLSCCRLLSPTVLVHEG